MSELIVSRESKLPTTLDDLSKFVLIGREKLVAVRAEIRAINKVGLAQEVRKQKLNEAQDIADAVLDAEVRIGELMAKVPKASGGDHGNQYTGGKNNTAVNFGKSKADVIEESGFTPMQVSRFETLAAHPDIVEQTKAEARNNDDIVSRSLVLNKIKEKKQAELEAQRDIVDIAPVQAEHKPHVLNNSGNNEWYTPAKYIELARDVLGTIDVDPASCEYANQTVKAKTYYSIENDGLDQSWDGKVWMNPPYSADLVQKFSDKIVNEYESGNTTEAIVLVNNATETQWFNNMVTSASAVAFPKGRIRYESTTKEMNTPLQGQAFIYFGDNKNKFCDVFKEIGWVAIVR